MYKPSYLFDRTPEQKRDMFAAWNRDDQSFFASGACHILADLFVQLHQVEGYRMIHIKPNESFVGHHVYASDGVWAFDHNGWTKEAELLEITESAYKQKYIGWGYTKHRIDSLEDFCKLNSHRLPWQYAHLPWERANEYIKRFDVRPSNTPEA